MPKKKDSLKKLITAVEVARIWNERAKQEGKEAKYTRFSVYGQREKLGGIESPLGYLYERERAETIPLPHYQSRPDVAPRNRATLKGKKRNKETKQFLKDGEN